MLYIPLVSAQAPSTVILIRAERFIPNPATAADNAFQRDVPAGQSDDCDVDPGPGRDGRRRPGPPRRRRDGPRLRGRGPHPSGQRLSEQLALHPRGRQHRRLPDVCLEPSARASRRRAGAAQVAVPGPDDRRLLRPRARRHLPRGHRRDGPRPRVAGRLHGAQPPGRHPRARAVLHRLRLRADGLRRGRLRGRAGLPHERHRLHRHRCRDDRPGDDPGRAASRRGPRAPHGQRPKGRRAHRAADPRVRRQRRGAVWSYAGGSAPLHHDHVGPRAPQSAPGPGRGDRGILRDRRHRHPHDRAGRRVGAVHDRRCPPRPAPAAVEAEPTAAVEAIDENPHTADGQDVAMGDIAD